MLHARIVAALAGTKRIFLATALLRIALALLILANAHINPAITPEERATARQNCDSAGGEYSETRWSFTCIWDGPTAQPWPPPPATHRSPRR